MSAKYALFVVIVLATMLGRVVDATTSFAMNRSFMCAIDQAGTALPQAGGTVSCWGEKPPTLPPHDDYVQVVVGRTFVVCALRLTGRVECTGVMDKESLKDRDNVDFTFISAANESVCGLTSQGILLCWGVSIYFEKKGTIGADSPWPGPQLSFVSIAVGQGIDVCGLTRGERRVVCYCDPSSEVASPWNTNRANLPPSGEHTDIAVGFESGAVLTKDGEIIVFGRSWEGHFVAPFEMQGVPFTSIAIGSQLLCGTTAWGAIMCTSASSPVKTYWPRELRRREASGTFTSPKYVRLTVDAFAVCGNVGGSGAIECYNFVPVSFQSKAMSKMGDTVYTQVSVSKTHACALSEPDSSGLSSVRCWGNDLFEVVSGAPSGCHFFDVTVNGVQACALRRGKEEDPSAGGEIECWGQTFNDPAPKNVRLLSVDAGTLLICGLTAPDRRAICWRNGGDTGKLGSDGKGTVYHQIVSGGYRKTQTSQVLFICGLPDAPNVPGADGRIGHGVECYGEMSSDPLRDGQPYSQLAAGTYFLCGLSGVDGSTHCAWLKDQTTLWKPPPGDGYTPIFGGADAMHLCATRQDGSVVCAGSDEQLESTGKPAGAVFIDVSCGYRSMCGILAREKSFQSASPYTPLPINGIVCWGFGAVAQFPVWRRRAFGAPVG
jgi:hypothetical protein